MEKRPTKFVLRNHNGRLLAVHTDMEELFAEMIHYESQTGNATRISVCDADAEVPEVL